MTAILHEMQRPVPTPPSSTTTSSISAFTPTHLLPAAAACYQSQTQHYGFQQQPQPEHKPQHFQQLQTPRGSQSMSSKELQRRNHVVRHAEVLLL
ncbi:hypothetical protein DPMN_077208 [Dreissena polymorpha]|uniref:Uncharacterized protein n=1 Tax=Dreissena polymorpha TaxID=45954 RepID=A0A9D3YLH9_DREPO|nr:hypothetical protein DPMN_077208 [Dreissena polymorpha]